MGETLREAVERLADEWDHDRSRYHVGAVRGAIVDSLRALLAEHPATPAEEEHALARGFGADMFRKHEEPAEVDVNRLRNWARAYQRLMQGGLSEQAHVACVDDFANDEGEYPYITAADVLALLADQQAR